MNILWKDLPTEFQKGTAELSAMLGLVESADGVPVTVQKGSGLHLSRVADGVAFTYADAATFFRGLSMLTRVATNGESVSENTYDGMLCLMADNSRNAVMTVKTAKNYIRYLALMGFNSFMLYTEDTYELKGHPYFGYLRGRFTEEELREIDDYAALFGVEMIPCIQTLAHLSKALQWREFRPVTDIGDIMLAGDERTYQIIDEMLAVCKRCFRSRRINLGMDEAHLLGRGKYLEKNGYRRPEEIMLEHLYRVTDLCKKHGYEPMIWSDMFFRMAFGTYRVTEGEVPAEVAAKVPEGLTLIYWDYYSLDRGIFSHMLDCHRKFPRNPTAFAGGAWCWTGFAPSNRFSLISSEMQLEVCEEYGMKNRIVTAWGDNGHEASKYTPLPVLMYFAEEAYAGNTDTSHLEQRCMECFGIGYEDLLTLDAPNELPGRNEKAICNPCKYLLYNDPLLGIFDLHMDADTVSAGYAAAQARLLPLTDHPVFGYLYRTLAALCRVLTRKADFGVRLRKAYRNGERETLAALAEETDGIVADLDLFLAEFRRQWLAENKPFGLEMQEVRIGAVRARMCSAKERILDYLAGRVEKIEELETELLPFDGKDMADRSTPYGSFNEWSKYVTVGIV